MIIQQTTDGTTAETVLCVTKNGEGATLPSGAAVIWDTTTNANGIFIRQPDTGKLWCFAGITTGSVASASTAKVLIQTYGYFSAAQVFQTNTSIAAGEPLVPMAGKDYLATCVTTTASDAAVTQQPIRAALAASVTDATASATIARGVFIQCM